MLLPLAGEKPRNTWDPILRIAHLVFFGAFALFACTTASIMSGAVIERIQTVGFTILAIVLGLAWVAAAAWGWHADGWLVTQWGLHDLAQGLCMRWPGSCTWRVGQSWSKDWEVQI